VTTHHYDRKGRLIRSVTRREAEWDEYEQALMLALGEYRSLTCESCHGWLPDTTAPEPERGHRWRVTAGPPCQACVAVDITATAAAKGDKQAHLRRWRVERNEGV
jgi:hypothetical protein